MYVRTYVYMQMEESRYESAISPSEYISIDIYIYIFLLVWLYSKQSNPSSRLPYIPPPPSFFYSPFSRIPPTPLSLPFDPIPPTTSPTPYSPLTQSYTSLKGTICIFFSFKNSIFYTIMSSARMKV